MLGIGAGILIAMMALASLIVTNHYIMQSFSKLQINIKLRQLKARLLEAREFNWNLQRCMHQKRWNTYWCQERVLKNIYWHHQNGVVAFYWLINISVRWGNRKSEFLFLERNFLYTLTLMSKHRHRQNVTGHHSFSNLWLF